MKRLNALSIACVCALLSACGQNDGDQYVGTWKKVSGQGMGVVIERNGNGYIAKEEIPLGPGSLSFPGAVKDGQFQIETGAGIEAWVIDKQTGHLVLPSEELERVSK